MCNNPSNLVFLIQVQLFQRKNWGKYATALAATIMVFYLSEGWVEGNHAHHGFSTPSCCEADIKNRSFHHSWWWRDFLGSGPWQDGSSFCQLQSLLQIIFVWLLRHALGVEGDAAVIIRYWTNWPPWKVMLLSAISCIFVLWYADADAENTSPETQRSRCRQATSMSQLGVLCCNKPEEDLQAVTSRCYLSI